MVKRIAITGPESTGKSTLVQNLARHFNAAWVPEFARDYLSQLERPYTSKDVEFIAQQQILLEKEISAQTDSFVFCDTATLVPKVWHEFKYNKESKIINKLWESRMYDYWFLCNTDIPWKPDPLREHPYQRAELFSIYEQHLSTLSSPVSVISGTNADERERMSINILNNQFSLLKN